MKDFIVILVAPLRKDHQDKANFLCTIGHGPIIGFTEASPTYCATFLPT